MIRLYLDWNVVAGLRDLKREPYISLKKKIEEYDDVLTIPYSPAHVDDLCNKFDGSEEKKAFILHDLEFLSNLTKDRCFYQPYKKPAAAAQILNPKVYFDNNYSNGKQSVEQMVDFSEFIDDPNFKPILDYLQARLDSIPVIDGKYMEGLPEGISNFMRKPNQSIKEFLNEFAKSTDGYLTNPKEYKELRTMSITGLSLNSNEISQSSNPIEKLNEVLPTTILGKSFNQHVEENSQTKSTENEFYEKVTSYYLNIDIFGVHQEKLDLKNTYENFVSDAQHAFFGSLCDIYVTGDDKALKKSKDVFTYFGINTLVLNPTELLNQIDTTISGFTEEATYFKIVSEAFNDYCIPENIISVETKENKTEETTYHLSKEILNYFNVGIHEENENVTFKFIQVHGPANPFILYSEIEFIVNKLIEFHGIDTDGKGVYSEEDYLLLSQGKWNGRQWQTETSHFGINFFDSDIQLFYVLHKKKLVDSFKKKENGN